MQIAGRTVSPIGLGMVPVTMDGRPPWDDAVRIVQTILDEGITFIDTADSYHDPGDQPGYGERLAAEALRTWSGDSEEIFVATKGGRRRGEDGERYCAASPSQLHEACQASLRNLGVDRISLYQLHRPDPGVPYRDSLGALKNMLDDGWVETVGVSNVTVDQLQEAADVLGPALVSVQNEFSPYIRDNEAMFACADRLGIAVMPYRTFGGVEVAHELGNRYPVFERLGREQNATPHQMCLRWIIGKAENVLPIPGMTKVTTARSSLSAATLLLSEEDAERIDQEVSRG